LVRENIKKAIEDAYGFHISESVDAPRQYVAETHFITTTDGNKYFCKIVNRPLFIQEIVPGLAGLEQIHQLGVERITYPIRGSHGLYLLVGGELVVVYNFVEGQQSFEYSMYEFGKFIGELQNVTKYITVDVGVEEFVFPYEDQIEAQIEAGLTYEGDDEVFLHLREILKRYEDEFRFYMSELRRLIPLCRNQNPELVLSHGDIPGNVMIRSHDDLTVIDWDELILAPVERDIWMTRHHDDFRKGYATSRPNTDINTDMCTFYLYKYYFRSMAHFLADIFSDRDLEYRKKYLDDLERYFRGWMIRYFNQVNGTHYPGLGKHEGNIAIREEQEDDFDSIDTLLRKSFGDEGNDVATLVQRIRASANYLPHYSIVAESDGKIVGHVMLSWTILRNGKTDYQVLTLSPLAVLPEHQHHGIGSSLVNVVCEKANISGEKLITLEGDHHFYSRLGFEYCVPHKIHIDIPKCFPPESSQLYLLANFTSDLQGKVIYPEAFDHLMH